MALLTKKNGLRPLLKDIGQTAYLVTRSSWKRVLNTWFYVPLGTFVALGLLFAVYEIINLSPFSFPASVACMIVLFLLLLCCQPVFGDKRTKQIITIIDIPVGFALRWMAIFFTPFFIVLPLVPTIGGVEVAKILVLLFVGFFVVLAATVYLVRALQLVFNVTKLTVSDAIETNEETDAIELSSQSLPRDEETPRASFGGVATPNSQKDQDISVPPRTQSPSRPGWPSADEGSPDQDSSLNVYQRPVPLSRSQRWATFVNINLDLFTYSALFLFIGLPVYYAANYSMPAHVCLNVLTYLVGLRLPASVRRIVHPVLTCSGLTILGIWVLALLDGETLQQALKAYKTNTTYIQLWDGQWTSRPGAGDIFSSCLDVGIVALGMPMYVYRKELKHYFVVIVIPVIVLVPASLYLWPLFCYHIGISSTRSLSFSQRALTLALASEATKNIGGDLQIMAVLCLVSGILGALLFSPFMKLLRVPKDDFATRGVAMGANASAIGTAFLLQDYPKAGALSSLSMGLLGTFMVIVTSIGPAVSAVRQIVGL